MHRRGIIIFFFILSHISISIIEQTIIIWGILTSIILIDISILNIFVVVVIGRNASIIRTCVPLSVLSLEVIVKVVSPIIFSCIVVVSSTVVSSKILVVILIGIFVVVRTNVVSLKIIILSL